MLSFQGLNQGKEKSKNENYIVYAKDHAHVIEIIKHEFENTSENWEIVQISDTNLVAVLNFK